MSKTFSTENAGTPEPADELRKCVFVEQVMSRLWTFDGHVIDPRDLEKLREDAARKYDEGWSMEDVAALFRCTEEVTPSLDEKRALARMAILVAKYKK